MANGCYDQIGYCRTAAAGINGGLVDDGQTFTYAATSNPDLDVQCQEAADMCRDNVESPYYYYGGRGVRFVHPSSNGKEWRLE